VLSSVYYLINILCYLLTNVLHGLKYSAAMASTSVTANGPSTGDCAKLTQGVANAVQQSPSRMPSGGQSQPSVRSSPPVQRPAQNVSASLTNNRFVICNSFSLRYNLCGRIHEMQHISQIYKYNLILEDSFSFWKNCPLLRSQSRQTSLVTLVCYNH
jgi:hypothetical protein